MSKTSKVRRKPPARKRKAEVHAKNTLTLAAKPGKSEARQLAEVALDPAAHALTVTEKFNRGGFGERGLTESYAVLSEQLKEARDSDLSHYRSLLAGQAIALNSIFTELSRRAALNMREFLPATETYMRLALKAQAQSRATIEALERLLNGREQTVRHVHVDNRGGQAVIAENVHNRGEGNGKTGDQSHATGAVGECAALPGAHPQGNGMPVPGGQREEPLQDARRDESWRS